MLLRRFVISTLPIFLLVSALIPLVAQNRVDDRNFGERLVLIVPLVGDGTPRNPRRPLYTQPVDDRKPGEGIVSYTAILSDDRQFAPVELVAHHREAFAAILKDARADVKKFDPVKGARKEDIETEFRKIKKDFDFGKFKEGK